MNKIKINLPFQKLKKSYLPILLSLLLISCKSQIQSNSQNQQKEKVENTTLKLKFTSGVRSILEDKKGNIWFGDRDTGAWKYDGKSMTNYIIDDKLKSQMINDIYQNKNEHLLFGMVDGGVYIFNENSFERKY